MFSKLRPAFSTFWKLDETFKSMETIVFTTRLLSTTVGPSPLQQLPTTVTPEGDILPITDVKEKGVARAVYRQLPISLKKLTLVARLVRKMKVEDALLQCDVVHKKAAGIVQNALRSAQANGVHNHGLDASKLYVEQCYATNGQNLKRIKYHGKGHFGRMLRRRTHLTVILREDPLPRPRPHRIQATWLQRQMTKEKDKRNPSTGVRREKKVLSSKAEWKTQLKRMRIGKTQERRASKKYKSINSTRDVN